LRATFHAQAANPTLRNSDTRDQEYCDYDPGGQAIRPIAAESKRFDPALAIASAVHKQLDADKKGCQYHTCWEKPLLPVSKRD
jgi:hypothetical protein